MADYVQNYLSEVLGVNFIVRPNSDLVERNPRSIGLYIPKDPSLEESQLLIKMMRAIGFDEADWMIFSALDQSLADFRAVISFGSEFKDHHENAVVLPEIHSFVGSGESVQAVKKAAWQKLKAFKATLS